MDDDELLTVAEVAQIFRVDHTTVRRWITIGALEAILLPETGRNHKYRVRRSTLDKYLNQAS